MRPTRPLIFVLCLGVFLSLAATLTAAQSPLCTGDDPGSVLRCYADAYAKRDSVSFAALLAPDYVSTDLSYPDMADVDYRTSLEFTTRMFRAPNIHHLELEFGEPARVEPGPVTGSWVLRDVSCTLRIQGVSDAGRPGPWAVTKVVSLWVRAVAEPAPHFLVIREELRDPEKK